MVYCERCGADFSSVRAATLRDCPRCLLRDDVAAPLVVRPGRQKGTGTEARQRKGDAAGSAPGRT
jgi:predicted  nucleic acid-binding Zn-ribbon protein